MNTTEKRKYMRIKSNNELKHRLFSLLGNSLSEPKQTLSKDFSAGGILFESDHIYKVGDVLRVELKVPGWEKYKSEFIKPGQVTRSLPIIALVKVVRVEITGFGKYDTATQFIGIDDDHQRALAKYIKDHIRKSGVY